MVWRAGERACRGPEEARTGVAQIQVWLVKDPEGERKGGRSEHSFPATGGKGAQGFKQGSRTGWCLCFCN